MSEEFISGLHHVNLLVPPNSLPLANSFYSGVLGFSTTPVPNSSKTHLAWFNVGNTGQQLHVTSEHYLSQAQLKAQAESPRHACFKIVSEEKLVQLQKAIYKLYEKGGEGAPVHCDEPGDNNNGQGVAGDFPKRFFARDYAGNRLEFSV